MGEGNDSTGTSAVMNKQGQNPIDSGYFYAPYVPLQAHSVHGIGIMDFGIFYGDTNYPTIHALWADVMRKEVKTLGNFVIDMLL